jgi:anti-sigma regulatory factor (Ser/Thr protein kinase)
MHSTVYSDAPASPRAARALVASALRECGVVEDSRFADALLVVSELFTNAMTHAAPEFELKVDTTDRSVLRVEVVDGSPEIPRKVDPPEAGRLGGWGLNLVQQLSLDWGVTKRYDGLRGKVVWAEVPVGRAA